MKKVVIFNTLISVCYFFLEFSFPLMVHRAEQQGLEAEMLTGMGIPVIGFLFLLLCGISVIYSVFSAIVQKKATRLLPILILLLSGIFYAIIFNQNSFWSSVIDYYLHL